MSWYKEKMRIYVNGGHNGIKKINKFSNHS